MGRCPYKGDHRLYEDYYCSQVGHGLPVFVGGQTMRGRGLGNLLGGLARSVVPLLKKGGKTLLREGAKTGLQLAQDVLSGQNLKSAAKQRAQQAGKRLLNQAVNHVTGNIAAPPGEPFRKRIKTTTRSSRGQKKKSKRTRRQAFADIFG